MEGSSLISALAILAVIVLIVYISTNKCPAPTKGECHGGTKTVLSYTSNLGQCIASMKEVACAGNSGIVKSGVPVTVNKSGDSSIPDKNLGSSGCLLSN